MPHQISLTIQNLLEPLSEIQSRSSINLVAGTAINEFYAGKIKRRLLDRKTENSKAPAKIDHSSAFTDHVRTTCHNIKWDHFDILASDKTDFR